MIETPKEAARRLSAPALAQGYVPQALHAYTDMSGEPQFWRIRLKHPDTGQKWIRPMLANGHGFELKEPTFPSAGKPLYALDRLVADLAGQVWIIEGEQKADTLNKLGLLATTSGSATSAASTDWSPLRGRTCTIWPDNDDAGRAYAGDVASIIVELGCKVCCLDIDILKLPEGGDVMDWLETHPDATRFDVEKLPTLTAESEAATVLEAAPEPPRALYREPAAAEAFPVESLGPLLREAALAIHDKVQAPLAICAQSVLALATLAAQAHANVVLPTGQEKPLSCYFLSVAASGERKSACDDEAMEPVRCRETTLRDRYEADLPG